MRAAWRLWGRWLLAGVVALGLIGGAGWLLSVRNLRAELAKASGEINGGYFALARERLTRLSNAWPGRAEIQYQLGVCEQGLGSPEAALAAWGKVPPGSRFSLQAALSRGRLAMELGRFSDAEDSFRVAAREPGPEAATARHLLPLMLGQEGRIDEAGEWIEAQWRDATHAGLNDRVSLLHDHIALEFETVPLEGNLVIIGARPGAKEDDRVWLSRANLATRIGDFKEAETWLDACARRRPNDPAVRRARLDWALKAGLPDEVRNALAQLADEPFPEPRVLALRAWFARQRGDAAAERQALESLVGIEPGNSIALDRLAELAAEVGETEESRRFLRKKAEVDAIKDRYRRLFKANRLAADAKEMAGLAERLGRAFEARAFLTFLPPDDPERRASLARLERAVTPRTETGRSVVRQLASELSPAESVARTPGNVPAPAAPPHFDDGGASLLGSFVLDNGVSPQHQLPETFCGGLALLDYDGDGWLDVYAVQGGPFPADPARPYEGDRLFHNRGDGTFEDATGPSGIQSMRRGYGHAAAVADFDNDGHPDLFVTRWRSYALYRNKGDGTFEDVTTKSGLGGDRDWPTSAAFADLDNDGDLDLYVCHYGVWNADRPLLCKDPSGRAYISCDPREIGAKPDHVFRNDGGRFVDVTREAGFIDDDGRGLGVVAADLDDDNRIDLFVANDSTANFLFRNLGGFRFEESGHASGVAGNAEGGYQAGMGVACADLDDDGRPDLVVTNFYDESTTFFRNLGRGLFADRSAAVGLAAASRYRLGFGVAAFDSNNDGRLDLLTANGHVNDQRPQFPYAMPAQLFVGTNGGKLTDATASAGPPFSQAYVGRGLAAGDLDNDGRVDAVMVAQNDPLVVFHNRTHGGHFLTLQLEGAASNRDGVGARVSVVAGGRRQVAQRVGGGSYASASDPRLHFGLGEATRVDSVEVRWPSGRVDRHGVIEADRGYLLREGEGKVRPLPVGATVRRPVVEK